MIHITDDSHTHQNQHPEADEQNAEKVIEKVKEEPRWPAKNGSKQNSYLNGINYEATFSIKKTPQSE